MWTGPVQCKTVKINLYIAEKDQFLAGNVAMPSNVNSVCKRSEQKLLAGIVAMQSL